METLEKFVLIQNEHHAGSLGTLGATWDTVEKTVSNCNIVFFSLKYKIK